jgi:opacity protein-like surface antigen
MILAVLISAAPIWAEEPESEGWSFNIAPLYLWAVDMGGTMTVREQGVPVEVAFADAVDNLQAAFTIHFEAWSPRGWGVMADLNWLDLGTEQMLPGPFDQELKIDLQQTIAELAVGYEFDRNAYIIGGARYIALEATLTLPTDTEINPDEGWVDGFIGFMWRPPLGKRWTLATRADVGKGSSDVAWNASAAIDYAVSRHVAFFLGYRYLSVDYTSKDRDFEYDVSQHGPLLALRFFW